MSFLPRNVQMLRQSTRLIKAAVSYNLVVFLVFYAVYSLIDFDKHYQTGESLTGRGKLYFAVMTHTGANTDGMSPKTDVGRMLQAMHVALAWMQLVLVVFVH